MRMSVLPSFREGTPDIDKRLPQAVARLNIAAAWPQRLCKSAPA